MVLRDSGDESEDAAIRESVRERGEWKGAAVWAPVSLS